MFGISLTELLLILTVALIVIGPDRLPELMYTIGKLTGRLQREFDDVRREFYSSVYTPASEMKARIDTAAKSLIEMPELDNAKSADKASERRKEDTEKNGQPS